MRLRFILHAIARHRTLLFAFAFALALALPARALGQDGPSEPVETADEAGASDPAAAGDIELTDEQVRALQETLKDLGYFFGPADGRRGPRTRTALRNFQRDQGLVATGSLDQPTVARIDEQSRIARTEHRPDADASAAPASAPAGGGGGGGVIDKTGDALKTGVGAVGTAGRATGLAGATAGKAIARAGVVTAKASATAGRAVATGSVFVYNQGRRAIVGDRTSRTDDNIRAAIERQYAEEDRIVPGEIEVRVVRGDVTLSLPDGARSDVAHAVRLARLTAGVKSVTTVSTSVTESK